MEKQVSGEILVLPFVGQGHLIPLMELCKRLASHNFKAIFIIQSNLSSSVPSSFYEYPLIEVVEIPNPPPPPPPPPEIADGSRSEPGSDHQHQPLVERNEPLLSENYTESGPGRPGPRRRQPLIPGIESFLSERYKISGQARPVCAVIDVMTSWSKESFMKFDIPIIYFFTSGACNSALEYAKWKHKVDDVQPGETRTFPGLPEDMGLSYADVKRQHHRNGQKPGGGGSSEEPGGGPRLGEPGSEGGLGGGRRSGPPERGRKAPWWEQTEGSMALLFNTSEDIDGIFINYLANQLAKPIWGVGPMLPEEYWKSAGSVVHDHEVRSEKESSVTEDEVMNWLDSKPSKSVLYISFGTEVGPNMEEHAELANALGELNRPFIWVIPPGSGMAGPPRSMLGAKASSLAMDRGYNPDGLDVGERGLVIRGWAPQLLILSHPSVGGFLSHCGWNSTVEAMGLGVPILAWPIRGDQICNAKFIVNHLKVGHTLLSSDDPFAAMKKDEIKRGIEMLMDDKEVQKRAMSMGKKFQQGFPASSEASLVEFIKLVSK